MDVMRVIWGVGTKYGSFSGKGEEMVLERRLLRLFKKNQICLIDEWWQSAGGSYSRKENSRFRLF